jgi:uncharacterized protein (UPF0128 family)
MAQIKASKPIGELAKGDKIKIDGKSYEVDAQVVLIEHPNNKEMGIELFDSSDNDYQLRYFNDQAEETLEFYELVKGVMYQKKGFEKIEW